jgi:hypothetical protein
MTEKTPEQRADFIARLERLRDVTPAQYDKDTLTQAIAVLLRDWKLLDEEPR